ncbi:MAG TPA: DUF4407 domain-containing protein [Longimicrobium sp.]|nr:DUF4407 domain-containing protein [Longimicrobium sp.]
MKRFLLFCSGAGPRLLNASPDDETRYVGLGATVLLTAVLASLSGGYALFTVFRSVPAAAALGVLWGVLILNLDRVIVSGMHRQNNVWMDVLYALPRLVLAVLLAVVISRPLELRLFEPEIEQRMMAMQIESRGHDIESIRAGDGERLNQLQRENARLHAEIEAGRRELRTAEEAWIREKEGTAGTGVPGAGPVYRERERIVGEAARRMRETEARNLPLIARNERAIDAIRAEQDNRIARMDATRTGAYGGFLARMEALRALKRESETLHWAGMFITLLFISLQTAPLVATLLSALDPSRAYAGMRGQPGTE